MKKIALITALRLSYVHAHGVLTQPAATYNDPVTATAYIQRVDSDVLFPGIKWNDNPNANFKEYQKLLDSGKIGILRTFVDTYISGCPKNNLDSIIDINGLSSMKWQNDQEKKGFIPSHTGPCEVWIDNKKVFSENNCASKYTSYPAEIPIDYSSCNGKCLFQFYWMALHEPMWQMYKACVIIKGTGSSEHSPNIPSSSPNVSVDYNNVKFNCSQV
jgi:hypothetical protein